MIYCVLELLCIYFPVINKYLYQKNKMKRTKYHIVGTVPEFIGKEQNITLSEQFQNLLVKNKISHCRNSSRIYW